jgi:hypothetical protein
MTYINLFTLHYTIYQIDSSYLKILNINDPGLSFWRLHLVLIGLDKLHDDNVIGKFFFIQKETRNRQMKTSDRK